MLAGMFMGIKTNRLGVLLHGDESSCYHNILFPERVRERSRLAIMRRMESYLRRFKRLNTTAEPDVGLGVASKTSKSLTQMRKPLKPGYEDLVPKVSTNGRL